MRVTIDSGRCEGHGRCSLLCPEVFDSDDEGHGVVVTDEVRDELVAAVRCAVADCPERAISLWNETD
jgi:ferredoxin